MVGAVASLRSSEHSALNGDMAWCSYLADACTMTTLVYGDEALTFVPVMNALSTAPAGQPLSGGGYDHASSAGRVDLPMTVSLEHVTNTSCGCLAESFLEADVLVRSPRPGSCGAWGA